jgi:hypothetical protein
MECFLERPIKRVEYLKEEESFFMKMEKYTREALKTDRKMDWGSNNIQITHIISEILQKIVERGRENSNGRMVRPMMANGKTTKNQEVGSGKVKTGFLMWVNGNRTLYKVLGC